MKKNLIIFITIIIVCAMAVTVYLLSNNDKTEPTTTGSSIKLDNKTYIKTLEKINIEGTNDYFIVTSEVKWPDHPNDDLPEGTLVSFEFQIPYKTIINDTEYEGEYILGDSSYVLKDDNPKYNIKVTNINDGEIEVLITKK